MASRPPCLLRELELHLGAGSPCCCCCPKQMPASAAGDSEDVPQKWLRIASFLPVY